MPKRLNPRAHAPSDGAHALSDKTCGPRRIVDWARLPRALVGPMLVVAALFLCATAGAETIRAPWKKQGPVSAALWWGAFQLIPSPALVVGSDGASGGLRWQLTPFLYSFGIAEKPARFFVISPVARHTGALEFYVAPEWICCAPRAGSSWLGRAGTRVYLPLMSWGESLSMSVGGSYYYANRQHGGAFEIGAYTLGSIVGVTLTLSPWLEQREAMVTLTLRYF